MKNKAPARHTFPVSLNENQYLIYKEAPICHNLSNPTIFIAGVKALRDGLISLPDVSTSS